MTGDDTSQMQPHLDGKRIILLPYNHADYAWRHTRRWHQRRYLAIFERILELFATQPAFRYFYDSYSECLHECLRAFPERLAELRRLLAEGRLAIVGGQWSNLRFLQAGDEAFAFVVRRLCSLN